jgi:hypothetical protein
MSRRARFFGDFKAAPDIRQSGPAASVAYLLCCRPKVKVAAAPGPDGLVSLVSRVIEGWMADLADPWARFPAD